MILKKIIQKTLDLLFKYVKCGQFVKGERLLKKRKILFFFLLRSSLYKSNYFFLFGIFLLNRQKYKKAIVYFKKSLYSRREDIAPHLFYLIVAFLKLHNDKQVIYYYKKLLQRAHNPFYIMLAYYYCTRYDEDFPFSIEEMKSILPEEPENIYEKLSFVIYYILSDKLSQAYKIMQEYKTTFNNIFFYNLFYLKILFLLKDYEEIVTYIEQNNEKIIESTELLNIFAASLFKLKLWDQSLQVLSILHKNTKDSANYKINIAKIFINKLQHIKAIKILKPLSKKTGNEIPYINFLLGLAHHKTGLINEAIYYYNKNINHYDEKAIFNLSLIYYDFNDFKNAKKYLFMLKNSKDSAIRELFNKWSHKITLADNSQKIKKINSISKFILFVPLFFIIFSLVIALFFIVILNYKR